MSSCPSRTELEDLIAGRLAGDRHHALDEHVTACPACQTTLETLGEPHDAFVSAVDELASLTVQSPIRPLQEAIERIKTLPRVVESGPSAPDSAPFADRTLGDFRIVRQVGRGGMGIVYEAEQISLGRKVALKTLPFAGLLDPRRLQRFQNESRAAASLEHPHIVSVYAVGVDRGVYYYAMRFINGPNLAEIIDQFRRRLGFTSNGHGSATPTATMPAVIRSGAAARQSKEADVAKDPGSNGSSPGIASPNFESDPDSDTLQLTAEETGPLIEDPTAAWTMVGTTDRMTLLGPTHIRRVVGQAIEAARALDFAHERGVVHRDVKPSNLMLDADGSLWITDFGLARIEAEPIASNTGEVMGTLRYMSPEQALGKRGVVDHRSDIYSLGVTLYELLTLTPIFPDLPDPVVLAKIAAEDPTPPRRLNRSIPIDLETIVLKAMSKEAGDRYPTAAEFADDLELFLASRKIKAQRRRLADRLARWLRRHPAGSGIVVTTVVALLIMAVGFAGYSAVLRKTIRERDESNLRLSIANQNEAEALRRSKQAGERADRALQASRQQVYAQDIERAARALTTEDVSLASNLLARHRPQHGQSDLRGFEWYWLRGRVHGTGRTLRVSQEPVYDAEYSPDEQHLATGGADGYLSVFETTSGKRILHVPTGQSEINAVAFSPDGKTIATTGDDSTIRLWDAHDGKPGLRMSGPRGKHAFSVLFTPDERRLVTTGNDSVIRIWNAATGAMERQFKDAEGAVNQIALSPDGKTLASANEDGAARLWDLATLTCRKVFQANEGLCLAVAFSPDGKRLVTGHGDRTVRVWNCADGTTALAGRLRDSLHDVCLLPSGDEVIAADGAGTLRVWLVPRQFEPPPKRTLAAVTSVLNGRSDGSLARWKRHEGIIHHIAVNRVGTTVVSAGNDGTVSLTDLHSGIEGPQPDWQPAWNASQFRFGPHDEILKTDRATKDDGYTPGANAQLVDLEARTEEHWDKGNSSGLIGIVLTPDGQHVLTGHDHATIKIHRRYPPQPGESSTLETWDLKGTTYVDQMEFLHDGRTLVVRLDGGPGHIRFYDYPTRKRLDRYPTPTIGETLVLSHSGRWLVSKGDRVGYIWDLPMPTFSIREFPSAYIIRALAVSRDDTLLATGGEDRKISLRSLPTGAVQNELIGHEAFVTSLDFSPDGRTLISGDLSGAVKVWSVPTGRYLFDLANKPSKIERIEFSPSGRYLAYSWYHGTMIVFDLQKLRTESN